MVAAGTGGAVLNAATELSENKQFTISGLFPPSLRAGPIESEREGADADR